MLSSLAIGLVGAQLFSSCASARNWEALYTFGDSYTDSGWPGYRL